MLRRFLVLFVIVPSFWAGPAAGDSITIEGQEVDAKVTAITPAGLVIETQLGSGAITVPFTKIDRVESDARFFVLFAGDDEAAGRIVGIRDGKLLIGMDSASAREIDVTKIGNSYGLDGQVSRIERLRSQFRHWQTTFDAGLAVTDGTTDTTNANFGFETQRRPKGSRLILRSGYLFGTQKEQQATTSTLNNELTGLIKGEYDVTERLLVLSSFDAEYDEIERLSFRGIPKLGLGYRLYKSDTAFFQLESAPSYNYERFFGGNEEDFFGVSFGAETEVKLPYAAIFTSRVDYLPAVEDWSNDYLIRAEAAISLPLVSILSFKAAIAEQYDNTPAPGNDRNELQTTLGLSLRL